MRYLFLFFLFHFPFLSIYGFAIKGIVKDAKTGEEIIGATILIKEIPKFGTVSGMNGSFEFNTERNSVTLICSSIGYKKAEQTVSVTDRSITILLEPDNFQLDEVLISGVNNGRTDNSARTIEKQSVNIVNIVSARSIEISPDLTVANVIQRISGVTVERDNTGDGQYAILRGMDKRYNYTLVNGVKIPSPDNKNRFVPLDIFPSELLDRLEVTKALTADMEGDGTGGAVNMIMKNAPSTRQLTANLSFGYNGQFLNNSFQTFNYKTINEKSPYELYGDGYPAKIKDFSTENLKQESLKFVPNLFGGFSYGDRFFNERLGFLVAGSFQNSHRGNNSLFFESATATSDASNLPILTSKNDRLYSEQQSRLGLHSVIDYLITKNNKVQWYNALMDLSNAQVRDVTKTDLNIGYNPGTGDYNLSFDTRLRRSHQNIFNSTIKGEHNALKNKLRIRWSGVYSKALNETPDNVTIHLVTTVRNYIQSPVSVVTLGGADRRWEHNTDADKALYLYFSYTIESNKAKWILEAGGLYREKNRDNFYNQYQFRPLDESKPPGSQNNLIKGIDWNTNDQIKFYVFNPTGSMGNQLNYDASEDITAGFGQFSLLTDKWHLTAGIRTEITDQGYYLKYPIDGVKNIGNQNYTDILPSLHVKYIWSKSSNLKGSYFRSINRPGFFEIVPYRIINEEYTETGNPDLKHTTVDNFDLRYEYFPRTSEQFMMGLFFKTIKNPIEYGMFSQGQGMAYMPANFGNALNLGIETDVTKYFSRIGFKANYTYTRSSITTSKLLNIKNENTGSTSTVDLINVEQTRPLYGQAKHVANLSLIYKDNHSGLEGQIAFAFTGERLYAVSRFYENDIWQGDYLQLDASMEKIFNNGFSCYVKATNLMNIPMVHYLKRYNESNESVEGNRRYKMGTLVRNDLYGQTVQAGVRYKF